jgi:hypothetical protein
MNSLEGRRGQPAVKPPFPAAVGVVRHADHGEQRRDPLRGAARSCQNGADWYKQWGSEKSPGTKLFCVSGHVNKPGNYELALGFPLMELIEDVCGGMRNGNKLKAVIPGASSVRAARRDDCSRCALDYEGRLGVRLDARLRVGHRHGRDHRHREAGAPDGRLLRPRVLRQCTPCREGTSWVTRILQRIEDGGGTEQDLDTLMELTTQMVGTTICVLSDSVAPSVHSSIKKFRNEYMALIGATHPRIRAHAGGSARLMADDEAAELGQPDHRRPAGLRPQGDDDPARRRDRSGTRVPHYCYHQGLSSPAMCRLCARRGREGAQAAARLRRRLVAEGQVVHTQSDKSLTMRAGVLEFYLKNHPLDCPICDQSGECKLPGLLARRGRFHGRGVEPKRVFGRDDFGGDVLFYGDRCVMCTRCVRFMNEVEQDPRLTVVERGDRRLIDTFFEEGSRGRTSTATSWTSAPSGALLSKDFPVQAACVGPGPHPVGVPELLAGVQHRPARPGQRGAAAQAARQPGRERVLDVRLRPARVRVDQPARPARGRAGARGRGPAPAGWKEALRAARASGQAPSRRW